MKVTARKYEDIEVEVSEEQIANLMLQLLKDDYEYMQETGGFSQELIEAIAVVYEAYSGKPIDYVARFLN